MNNCNPWEYTELEYPGQLAYLTVSCTTRCNFACVYCSKKGRHLGTLLIKPSG